MKLFRTRSSHRQVGFTLVNALASIAIIAVIVTVGVTTFRTFSGAIKANKLQTDIAKINTALQVYEASGGNFDSLTEPQAIINKLKMSASAAQYDRLVGLRDTMTDPRLVVVMQTAAEATSNQPRALWNPGMQRFEIKDEGAAGIKELVLDESISTMTAGTDDRETSVKYADNGPWVWNYQDRATLAAAGPQDFSTGSTSIPGGAPNSVYAQTLDPPQMSMPSGTYALSDYDFAVSLINPNPPGASNIFYSVDSADWYVYDGTPIGASPGTTIIAMAVTLDPDSWKDSDPQQVDYLSTPVEPLLAFSAPSPTLTYAEVGGAMVGVAPVSPLPGTVFLANPTDIPALYQSDSVFTIHWTYDGSDPLNSPTRLDGDPFAGGFPGQDVATTLARWGSATTLDIKVAAESRNSSIVTDSPVITTTLSVEPMALRPPSVSDMIAGGGPQTVTIGLETSFGDMPEGARIYYTTDGTDPGVDSSGNPVAGTLYESPFEYSPTATTEIVARVYAPTAYSQWFTASPACAATPTLPVIVFTMSASTSPPRSAR